MAASSDLHPRASALVRQARLADIGAQRAVITTPNLVSALADNPVVELHPEVVEGLYFTTPKPAVKVATSLVGRPLDAAMIDHILDVESRPAPLAELVRCNTLTREQTEKVLASKGCNNRVGEALLNQEWIDPELELRVAAVAGGDTLLEWLITAGHDLPDTAVSDLFERWDDWKPSRRSAKGEESLGFLFSQRPSLLTFAARPGADLRLRMSASVCRFLSDEAVQFGIAGLDDPFVGLDREREKDVTGVAYLWMMLGNSPACQRSVLDAMIDAADALGDDASLPSLSRVKMDEAASSLRARRSKWLVRHTLPANWSDVVEDADQLRWLAGRTLPSNYEGRFRPGRPWDLAELAMNPHLGEVHARMICNTLSSHRYWPLTPSASALIVELRDRFHGDYWTATYEAITADEGDDRFEFQRVERQPGHVGRRGDTPLSDDWSVSGIHGSSWERFELNLLAAIEENSADPFVAWTTVLGIIDDWDGTVGELVSVATLV